MAQTQISSYTDETPTPADVVNLNTNNLEKTVNEKETLETALSSAANGITARVVSALGTVLKVKWFKDGKVFGSYKTKLYNETRALASLTYLMNNKLAQSIALTGTQSGTVGGTVQYTATLTRTTGQTANISSIATWTTSNPAIATVNSAGLVTRVAAGTATITATYAGISGTRTVTNT